MKTVLEPAVKLKPIPGTARQAGVFKTFLRIAEGAGLLELLNGEGPMTVFAPNDKAFAKLSKRQMAELERDKKKTTDILTYHIVAGKLTISAVMALRSMRTLQGGMLTVDACDGLSINEGQIIKADLEGTNGLIHGIDTVLYPKK